MKTISPTRRTFVAGCAGAAALALAAPQSRAFAEGGRIGVSARPDAVQVNALCAECPSRCGYSAFVVEGELDKALGCAANPASAGTLCARGYGAALAAPDEGASVGAATGDDGLSNPLERQGDGKFATLSWDEALGRIAERLQTVSKAKDGAVVVVYDGGNPTAAVYGPRLAQALNAWALVDDITFNVAKQAAFSQVIGVGGYTPDFAGANMALLIDTSFADVAVPGTVVQLQTLRQRGVPVVAIDPRLGTLASMADDWKAVNPGGELALLLAVCNWLVRNGRYDGQFVAQNAEGFDQWAQAIDECTAEWAEPLCGVPAAEIESLAAQLAQAAPRVAIEYGNGSIGAAALANATETARVVCLLNALLGTWNQEGGALLPFDYGAIGTAVQEQKTEGDFALGAPFGSSVAAALQGAAEGKVKALVLLDVDVDYDYANVVDVPAALQSAEVVVYAGQVMNRTAAVADYVLPLLPALESASLPVLFQGREAGAAIAQAVLSGRDTNARALDDVVRAMAMACGASGAVEESLHEAAVGMLEPLGLEPLGLAQAGSAQAAPGMVSRVDEWRTPSGKIEFSSAACDRAGAGALALWEPLPEVSDLTAVVSFDQNFGQDNQVALLIDDKGPDLTFNLISGQQAAMGPASQGDGALEAIVQMYELDRVWINSLVAEQLGIATGDKVLVSNDRGSCRARAFVTGRIAPTAVFLPSGFGRNRSRNSDDGESLNPVTLEEPRLSAGFGTLCTQGACVKLTKEGE